MVALYDIIGRKGGNFRRRKAQTKLLPCNAIAIHVASFLLSSYSGNCARDCDEGQLDAIMTISKELYHSSCRSRVMLANGLSVQLSLYRYK